MRRGALAGLMAALFFAPAAAHAGPEPLAEAELEPEPARRIEAVVVVAEDVDAAQVIDALSLRAPERAIQPAGRARPRVPLFVVAEVRMKDPHTVAVAVIASDFRAWYRTVEATPEDAARVAASTLANLLAGIEEDRELPDAEDVPLPQGATEETEPPKPKADPPEPKPEPKPDPRPDPAARVPEPAVQRAEILVELAGAAVIGIPPPRPAGFAAGGGTLGVGLHARRGWVGGLELRVAGRSREDLGLVRVRVSAQIGWVLRRRAFELVATVGPDIEPLLARKGGAREDFTFPDGTTRRTALLVGGHLRVSPGVRIHAGGADLRIAPRVELGGAALESGGVARLFTAGDDPLLRAGGLELAGGIELGGWIPVARGR